MKHFFRSLAHRFLIGLAGLLLLAISALFLIERLVVMPVLLEEENRRAAQELARIGQALEHNRSSLLAQVRDWAHWDDTYEFVQGRHDTYASANFSREMFEDMNYQVMVFYTAEKDLYWVAGIDPATGKYTVCSRATNDCLWTRSLLEVLRPLLADTAQSGFAVNVSRPWPAMAAVAPILRTDRSGAAAGWLVKVRLIDSRVTSLLEEQTGLPVAINARKSMASSPEHTVVIRDSGQLEVSRRLAAQTTDPALELTTRMPRERFQTAARLFRFALAWTAALLLLVMLMVLSLLLLLVIRPLGQFTRFTRSQHGINSLLGTDSGGTVPPSLLKRRDEFGTLAHHFQSLLDQQHAQGRMLLKLSQHDSLTGLANRRLFDASLEQALMAPGEPAVSVMMIDIDHFKLYNDHYGHPAGDECLVRVAEAMQATMGQQGLLVARTGGEEFNILLPGTPLEVAMEHAETLRQSIEDLGLEHTSSPVLNVVTVSVGVASTRGISKRSGTRLMSNADQALYQAKDSGRNRVTGYAQESALSAQ
ncbi:diguanylate cyclase domain-containing protein [Marinobacter lacisalsi]|uniref:diguanylate cyclase n=1 Tax=Marinobacter lacisalsi TaxID=475979 RepID=A0ABV8QK15_9GAMM